MITKLGLALVSSAILASNPAYSQVGPGGPYPGAPIAQIIKSYSDSSYRTQVGEFITWCDGSVYGEGLLTENSTFEDYPCP